MKANSIDLKKLLNVSSENSSKEKSNRVSYSKETLIILSRNPPCHTRPDCLSEECLGDDGVWDPEKWHQSFDKSSPNEVNKKTFEMNDIREESDVVFGPQRRSFQGGCHVASKEKSSSSFSRSLSTTSSKLSERTSKLHRQDEEPHLKRFQSLQNGSNDWSKKDTDNKKYFDKLGPSYSRKTRHSDYKRYIPPNKKYSESFYYDDNQYDDSEPEWISYGPKSQSDTIELSGFDTADDFSWMGKKIPMDDVPERKKKSPKRSDSGDTDNLKPSSAHDDQFKPVIDGDNLADNETGNHFLKEIEDKSNKIELTNGTEHSDKEAETEKNVSPKEGQKVEEVQVSMNDTLFNSEVDASKESRFSRWFSVDVGRDTATGGLSDEKFADKQTADLFNTKEDVQTITALKQPTKLIRPEPIYPTTTIQPSTVTPSVDPHTADAFNKLIASIRASDKVKEEMQQRNQRIQALQTMNTDQARSSSCFNLSSIESPVESTSKNIPSNLLKQQLERQKDAYQQKMRQIEQQNHKSSSSLFGNNDLHSLKMNQGGLLQGYSMQNSTSHLQDALDERAAAAASLAAKLAGKSKDESNKLPTNTALRERLYGQAQSSQQIFSEKALFDKEATATSFLKLQSLQHIISPTDSKSKSYPQISNPSQNNLKSSSLAIAQMLANAGVTEEQLKQLTIEQQELVITLVKNQYSQKEIGKYLNLDARNVKAPEQRTQVPVSAFASTSLASNVKDLFSSKSLPVVGGTRLKNGPTTTNLLSFLTDNSSTQPGRSEVNVSQGVLSTAFQQLQTSTIAQSANAHTRLLSRNLMHVQPAAIMSPVVPLVSPNIAPRMLTPPHIPLVQPTLAPPHPALLLQLQQQQQLYANQLVAQQQAVLAAALQKQQLVAAQAQQPNNETLKLQQSVQNFRLASARSVTADSPGSDRSQFNNPLAQWFSSDILRQSQFPPVSQLTGQQTMKLSNTPHDIDPLAHNAKQH